MVERIIIVLLCIIPTANAEGLSLDLGIGKIYKPEDREFKAAGYMWIDNRNMLEYNNKYIAIVNLKYTFKKYPLLLGVLHVSDPNTKDYNYGINLGYIGITIK